MSPRPEATKSQSPLGKKRNLSVPLLAVPEVRGQQLQAVFLAVAEDLTGCCWSLGISTWGLGMREKTSCQLKNH